MAASREELMAHIFELLVDRTVQNELVHKQPYAPEKSGVDAHAQADAPAEHARQGYQDLPVNRMHAIKKIRPI